MTPPLVRERVLSTLNQDGSRFLIRPKVSRGRFHRRRQVVAYALIALFVALPFLRIGGRPAFLIDLAAREISILGAVFRPSDGFVLMLLGLAIVLAVFLVTALFGRVWCGWGCPQTVYLEYVFRPIERWLEGSVAQQRKLDSTPGLHPRRVLKWAIYLALSFVVANVFLAYFVGTDRLAQWLIHSPADHLAGFTLVLGVTALMMFDFVYFREQTCIVACPYGRLQTVLLDKQSLIVGYDATRGEPRGKRQLKVLTDAPPRGDCVDCGACVAVCPTGIDIRDGLQMECIGCAQCIDACDTVMDKLRRPRHLIGYSSQDVLAGKAKRIARVRTIVYPVLLVLVTGLLAWGIATRASTQIWIGRIHGPAFVDLGGGMVASQVRLKLENESDELRHYSITLHDAPDAKLRAGKLVFDVRGRKSFELPLFVDAPQSGYVHGKRAVTLRIADDRGFARLVRVTLLGPESGAL